MTMVSSIGESAEWVRRLRLSPTIWSTLSIPENRIEFISEMEIAHKITISSSPRTSTPNTRLFGPYRAARGGGCGGGLHLECCSGALL